MPSSAVQSSLQTLATLSLQECWSSTSVINHEQGRLSTRGWINQSIHCARVSPPAPACACCACHAGSLSPVSDVWSSADGVEWVCHIEHAPFPRRFYHTIAACDNKLWVLEGHNSHPHRYPEEPAGAELPPVGSEGNRNDVWWSDDGQNWHELKGTPWPLRHAASVAVHQDALWISVGNTDWTGNPKLKGAEGFRADVWFLQRGAPEARR